MDPPAAAHQRGQPSTSSVVSFDESNEHATDYISGMYVEPSMSPPASSQQSRRQQQQYPSHRPPLSTLNHHTPPIRKKVVPPPPPPKDYFTPSPSSSPTHYNSSIQSTPSGSPYQRSNSSDSVNSNPSPTHSPPSKSPPSTRLRIRPTSPSPPLSTMPLSGLDGNDDGSSPSSPAEIAKELSNLQAFKRMSLDTSHLVSDPDLPSNNRVSIPDYSELLEAGVDSDAARLLWLHPEISANDDWKDFVQRRVEETKSTGTISRVKSIGGGSTNRARLSRSKSILSRQIDASDEETWQTYSDAGHKELERRSSSRENDAAGTGERHMITVSELEKLEALIREGALERGGRPLSEESVESIEGVQAPLAADVIVPLGVEEAPPLMPMKGTLRRSAHTSIRGARRGALAGVRTARRSSEPRKGGEMRISQETTWNDDGTISPSKVSPTGVLERSPSMPVIEVDSLAPQEGDKTRTSAPAILEQLEVQNLPRPTSGVIQQQQQPQPSEPFLEDGNLLLGQVQPRHNRRPPLRRQTAEAPQTLPIPSRSPTKDQPTPLSPEEKPLKKSPVSPSFPTQQQPPQSDYRAPPEPEPPQLIVPVPPLPSPSPPATQSKRTAWSRLFNTSSDDEPVKEKPSTKGKPKKSASYSERPKPSIIEKSESKPTSDLDRSKSLSIEPISPPTPTSPIEPASTPAQTSGQSKSSKKESGLFASLFGSKKKSESKEKASKTQDTQPPSSQTALANDNAQYQRYGQGGWDNSTNAGGPPAVLNFYYTRFPIHIERAIYRLSHIKLANPRRPLVQQVLLSNFMYGYLNLINKSTQPSPTSAQQTAQEVPTQAPYPGETYPEQAQQQQEEHVFYSSDEPVEYYGQDYYGAEYEDDQDESIPGRHDGNSGYGYAQTNGRAGEDGEQYLPQDSRGYGKRYGVT